MTKCFDWKESVWYSCYRQTLRYWRAYCPICIMLYHDMFSSFNPWCMLLWDHTDDNSLGLSVSWLRLLFASKCRSRGTGTGWRLMTVFYCLLAFRKCQSPHLGPVWTLWLAWLTWREGKREGLFLGCFCLSRQAYREAANGTCWMVSPSSASVCCPSSAVLD